MHCVSYYRGKDKKVIKKVIKKDGQAVEMESEIDLIIEENGILYPIEIKQNAKVSTVESAAFTVLDKLDDKKRGMGAIVCLCPQPGMLRENVLQLAIWYIWLDNAKEKRGTTIFYPSKSFLCKEFEMGLKNAFLTLKTEK